MLNRKYADLRHAPALDPIVLRYDRALLPQSVVRLGPRARRKVKGGALLGGPGFTWALYFQPGRWWMLTSVFDASGALAGHHVDLGTPPEELGGMLTFVDLKLDLLVLPSGEAAWLDQDDYDAEIAAGTIRESWQAEVALAVAGLDQGLRDSSFPPPEVLTFRPA